MIPWPLFHQFWTAAVAQPGYDKAAWQQLQFALEALEKDYACLAALTATPDSPPAAPIALHSPYGPGVTFILFSVTGSSGENIHAGWDKHFVAHARSCPPCAAGVARLAQSVLDSFHNARRVLAAPEN